MSRLYLACHQASRDAELDRLTGLGSKVVDDQRRPDGKGWVVLADPAGNEFLRGAQRRREGINRLHRPGRLEKAAG